MKVGNIVETNQKGQLVIPKKIRDLLGITPGKALNILVRDNGVYIQPIDEVVSSSQSASSYYKILKRTQGSWVGDDWPETQRKQRKIDLVEAKRAKEEKW
jgi:AbrB family looped-hinge helix DNA binding protein